MSEHLPPDDQRVERRSELLDDERAAGSDDPQGQAEAILEESDARQLDREDPPGGIVEHRRSDETVAPEDT